MDADPRGEPLLVDRPTMPLQVTLNGRSLRILVEPRETLAEVLRNRLAMTGTKVSCDAQVCGSCTVLLDDLPVSACTVLAIDADGHRVETIEGLADPRTGQLSVLQQAFVDHAAFQCGFCTPGFILTAESLLREMPSPSREQVVEALDGNICRCTGYAPIIEAVLDAASRVSR